MLVRYEPLAIPSAKSNRQPHVESLCLVSPSTVDRAVGVGDVFPGDNGPIAELPDALLSQPRKKRFERPPIVVDARPLLRGRDVVEDDVCVMVGDHLVDVSSADGVRPACDQGPNLLISGLRSRLGLVPMSSSLSITGLRLEAGTGGSSAQRRVGAQTCDGYSHWSSIDHRSPREVDLGRGHRASPVGGGEDGYVGNLVVAGPVARQ